MAAVLDIDPELLKAVRDFRGVPPKDRRRAPRKPFRIVQHIAQANDSDVPEWTSFFPVQCHDLSTGGFSFFIKRRPQFNSIVLGLGEPPDVAYLAAEVKHCTNVLRHGSGEVDVLGNEDARGDPADPDGSGPERMVLVGCQFVQRLESDND